MPPPPMQRRQRQASAPPASNAHTTSVTLHFKERNNPKQPLYRPAALRRNGSVSRDLFAHPSPPLSPSIAVTESRSSSWLTSLAGPFSPTLANANDASKELGSGGAGTAVVRGYMIPRSQWKPDDTADQCADPDCSQRFDLMHRRHHCRTCGDIYCSTHSSRSTFLWPSAEDDAVPAFTPRGTPRSTPRSSAVDLPSLVSSALSNSINASSISTTSTGSSASADTSTPTSSPPRNQPAIMPVSARVCDRCYFSAPSGSAGGTPLLLPPNHTSVSPPTYGDAPFASAASAFALSSRPLQFNLRHPRSRTSSASRPSSPNNSPPGHTSLSRQASLSRSRQRSRQGSAVSASSSTSASIPSDSNVTASTPSTSVEGAALDPSASSCGSMSSTTGTSPETLQMAPSGSVARARLAAIGNVAGNGNGAARRGGSLGRNGSKRTLCSTAVTTPKVVREGEVLSSYETETERTKATNGGGGVGAKLAATQRRRPQSQPARVNSAAANDAVWTQRRYPLPAEGSDDGNSTDGDRPPYTASARPNRTTARPRQNDASQYFAESDSSSLSEASDDDDERHERVVRERRMHQQEFGSVQGGPWQSWATF
ncbi:hypothetical protein BMF94_5324 [Rhodotorula taiwanensis]|uniref:FYVE zinc finger domain-containing protein n=1 Tax=Rhodotorula taiwanensis TaxID=741276 RepID=A0A2S5B4J2_9BASI|nr:hypothetical protein BMF94_5324 [Rhodotorula taiwanensis]